MTASPQQLQTMLFDGAIRFCEQARAAMEAKDVAATYDRLIRVQKIVLELSTSLKVEVAPDLCAKLASLYNYIYRLLIDANLKKDMAKLDEALNLLRYQRETWLMALESLRNPAPAGQSIQPSQDNPAMKAINKPAATATSPASAKSNPAAANPVVGGPGQGGLLCIEG